MEIEQQQEVLKTEEVVEYLTDEMVEKWFVPYDGKSYSSKNSCLSNNRRTTDGRKAQRR